MAPQSVAAVEFSISTARGSGAARAGHSTVAGAVQLWGYLLGEFISGLADLWGF
jgi:hypothetical protein